MHGRLGFYLGLGFLALAVPGVALAQNPAGRGYGGQGGNVQADVAGNAAGGVLPFTGLDLLLMVVAATLLIAAGLTMRRLVRVKA
jgi:hypothetical protein